MRGREFHLKKSDANTVISWQYQKIKPPNDHKDDKHSPNIRDQSKNRVKFQTSQHWPNSQQ